MADEEWILEIESFKSEQDCMKFAETLLKGKKKKIYQAGLSVNAVNRSFSVINIIGDD